MSYRDHNYTLYTCRGMRNYRKNIARTQHHGFLFQKHLYIGTYIYSIFLGTCYIKYKIKYVRTSYRDDNYTLYTSLTIQKNRLVTERVQHHGSTV